MVLIALVVILLFVSVEFEMDWFAICMSVVLGLVILFFSIGIGLFVGLPFVRGFLQGLGVL